MMSSTVHSRRHRDQAALGEHADDRHGHPDRRQHPGEGAGCSQIASRVEQYRVAEAAIDQRGSIERQHRDPVGEQAQGGQHFSRRLSRGSQQDQIHPCLPIQLSIVSHKP